MTTRPMASQSADQVQPYAVRAAARRSRMRVRVVLGCALAMIVVAAFIFAYMARGGLLVVIVLVVPPFLYWASLRLRPYAACRKCEGTGKVRGLLFRQSRAFCLKCGGTGLVPRFGTRFLASEHRPPDRRGTVR